MALAAALVPVPAAADVDPVALDSYARGRLADGDGALDTAMRSYRRAFVADPDNAIVAVRAYRRGIDGGDRALALLSARRLDEAGLLPRDGTLLLLGEALTRKDWEEARALTERLKAEENYAFLAPVILSWLSLAEGDYAPPAVAPDDRFANLTRRYVDEHVALQRLARGEVDLAMPHIARALSVQTGNVAGLRAAFALRLAELGRKEQAVKLIGGDGPRFAALRTAIDKAQSRGAGTSPAQGFARLLGRLSDDLAGDATRSVAFSLARLASFADPASVELRLGVARQLNASGYHDAAVAEAAKVPRTSWLALSAEDLRVEAMAASGRQAEALALAQALTERPDAGSAQYMRLANLHAEQARYAAAAAAYARARSFYAEGTVPWSLHLLEGSALERGGRWEEARVALQKAAEIAPDEPVVLNYLGYAQVERRQNVEAALGLLRRASLLMPNDPSITDSLGWANFVAGRHAEAVPVLERAAAGAPADATINEHLGDALWTVGRRIEARYAWTAAGIWAEGAAAERLSGKLSQGLLPELAAP